MKKVPPARFSPAFSSLLTCLCLSPAIVLCGARPPAAQEAPPAPRPAAGSLNVVGAVPLPEESLDRQIVFFFDGDLAPAFRDAPTSSALFRMDPPLPGALRVGPRFIAYQLDTRPENIVLKVELNDDLASVDGRRIDPGRRSWKFINGVFEPAAVWGLEQRENATTLGIRFSFTVDPATAGSFIVVEDGKGPVSHQIDRGDNSKILRLRVQGNPEWPITIRLEKGLPDATGSLTLGESRSFSYPAESNFWVGGVEWGAFSENAQTIVIRFSEAVDSHELAKRLSIVNQDTSQTVGFEIGTNWEDETQVAKIQLGSGLKANLLVNIAAGLPGANHRSLKSAAAIPLAYNAEPAPQFSITEASVGERWGEGLEFRFNLNRKVSPEELKRCLSLSPELPNLELSRGYWSRFQITGDWKSNQTYELTLKAGLKDIEGNVLSAPIAHTFTTGDVPSSLKFGQKDQYYFPRREDANLILESRNLKSCEVRLHRMFPSNIAVALSDMEQGNGSDDFVADWSEEVGRKKFALTTGKDVLRKTHVPLASLLPDDRRGIFCAESVEEMGDPPTAVVRDRKIVLMTNIGLLSHWLDGEVVVFAHDLFSLAPVRGAKISVYSNKNQLLGKAVSDAQGMVHLKDLRANLGQPAVAVAEKDGDFSFLKLEPRADDQASIEEEAPPFARDKYDAFLYADRELYRPGETAHLRWTVRTNYGDAVASAPLLLRVIKPNEQDLLTVPVPLSKFGTGGLDIATEKYFPTGKYTAEMKVPGEEAPIGSYEFYVEEFVPTRTKVALSAEPGPWVAGEDRLIHIAANHLFGAPASNRKSGVFASFERGGFKPKKWQGYRFENDSDFQPGNLPCGEAETGEDGKAVFTFHYNAPPEATFPLLATIHGRVYELGGRPISATTQTLVLPSGICVGIAASSKGKGIEVLAAAIKPDEAPADLASLKITLEKQTWNYYVRRYYSHNQMNWSESFESVETREVALKDGAGSTRFDIKGYGYYRVRAHSEATPQLSSLTFYSYGGKCDVVDPSQPSLVKVSLDKKSYKVGETATARVESPFDGKGIVVLQGDTLQRVQTIDIRKGVGTARIEVKAEQFPNCWVEATVIHAFAKNGGETYPFSSCAVANLKVEDPKRQLKVAFSSLPEEIKPATHNRFDIEVVDSKGEPAAETEITLAAVDEGIHLMTGYESPDPLGWLGRTRKAEVRRAHYYDRVVLDFLAPAPGGGEDDSERMKRIAPPDENWIKTVALWSGAVRTDRLGRASVEMDVPEYTGQLRLVAVAASARALGAASRNLYVRRPFLLRTSLPRFALPGDSFESRGSVYNNSPIACRVRMEWTASGAMKPSSGSIEVEAPSHREAAFSARFEAGETVGQGAIEWKATILDANGEVIERLAESDPLPVRAPAVYQTRHALTVLKPGQSQTIVLEGMRPSPAPELELTVSASPLLRLQKALAYVLNYSYGCIEQTTSKLMPLYLLRNNLALLAPELAERKMLDQEIRIGVNRLFSMQTTQGALAFWPGSDHASPYGSVYAFHFLTLLKNGRSFELPAPALAKLKEYVRGLANDGTRTGDDGLFLRSYAIYTLALDGDLEAIKQIERFDTVPLPRHARLLLAAALARNTKDTDRVKLYLSKAPVKVDDVTMVYASETLDSDIRNTAIQMMALRQAGGAPEEIAGKGAKLASFLENSHHGNTQETAFAITALGEWLAEMGGSIGGASATVEGPGGRKQIGGAEMYRGKGDGVGSTFTVSNSGKADLYVYATRKGIPERPEPPEPDRVLKVQRTMRGIGNHALDGSRFRQTDSYIVTIEIECDQYVSNVALVDMLPAGFEVENPRLKSNSPGGPALDAADDPDYLDIRDDRVIYMFNSLSRGSHRVHYVVNAVTPGRFTAPGARAECMYDSSIHGASPAAVIEVK